MGWNGGIRVTHEASLAATVGSFAQNVVYRSAKDHVCPICGGAKGAGYAVCVSCSTAMIYALTSVRFCPYIL